jgi:hypothetical protein
MRELWTGTGLDAVETRVISVRRTFPDFERLLGDDSWIAERR